MFYYYFRMVPVADCTLQSVMYRHQVSVILPAVVDSRAPTQREVHPQYARAALLVVQATRQILTQQQHRLRRASAWQATGYQTTACAGCALGELCLRHCRSTPRGRLRGSKLDACCIGCGNFRRSSSFVLPCRSLQLPADSFAPQLHRSHHIPA
jgi:hypothetical protein